MIIDPHGYTMTEQEFFEEIVSQLIEEGHTPVSARVLAAKRMQEIENEHC